MTITRVDKKEGWSYNLVIDIILPTDESIMLFQETIGTGGNWVTSYVKFMDKKIFDSRDLNYYNNNKEW